MKVKVLRNFLIAGEVQKEGKVIDVPNALGQELIFANKAEKAAEGKAKAEKAAEGKAKAEKAAEGKAKAEKAATTEEKE